MNTLQKKPQLFLEEYGKVVCVGLSFIFIIITLLVLLDYSKVKKLEVSFLDVGQGDAILITTPSGKQMLVDGGPTHTILEEVAKHTSYFDHTLDVIVATHPDSDHVTGLIPILQKYDIKNIVTSNVEGSTGIFSDLKEKISKEGATIHIARKGDVIDFGDGVVAHILYPKNSIAKDTNDGSVSMVVIYGEHSFLLTGDLSAKYEPQLIGDDLQKNITVYKAAHHGSKTSSSDTLLSYIKPEYVVISAGKDNNYGHPHQETLSRLQKYTKEIISTIDRGAITFISDGKLLNVITEK